MSDFSVVGLLRETLYQEVGKKWKGMDGKTYKLTLDGLFVEEDGEFEFVGATYIDNNIDDIREVYIPDEGQSYWVPLISSDEERTLERRWWGNRYDEMMLKRSMVFKTEAEAKKMTSLLLRTIKKARKEEENDQSRV